MRFFRLFTTCAAAVLFVVTSAAQTIQINRENKTIAISTTDEATALADIASMNIGFEIFKPDANSASIEAGKLSHAIMEALHKAGVDDKSIESKSQSLSRNVRFDEKESAEVRAQRQFRFEQSWEVLTTPQDAAAILRLVLAAGANQSGNIDWRLADRKGLQAIAGSNALVKAHAVAEQMAEGLHVKLGMLIYASNEVPEAKISFTRPKSLGYGSGGNVGGGMYRMEQSMLPLEIRPAIIHEDATVYAVFAIE
jgi:uncharacterized protein YggE